jgi:hypothetical protein
VKVVNNTNVITNPKNGDLVFNTSNQSYQYFDEVTNTWQSIAVPAMTTDQRDAIAQPNNGQTIFNIDELSLNTYFNGLWNSFFGVKIIYDATFIPNPRNGDLVFSMVNQSYQYFDAVTNTWQSIAVPAMTTDQRNAIIQPNNGQTIFNIDQKCLNTYYNGIWISQCGTQEVNNTTINNITNPTNGQIVYNTDYQTFQYYDAVTNTWRSLVVPAMDSVYRNSAVLDPLPGQTIFNTDENCLNTYYNGRWNSLCGVKVVNNTNVITNPKNGDLIFNTSNQSYQYFDEVTNTWQSIAVPAMTTDQRNAITQPNNGQTIFNIDQKCLNTYYNQQWLSQCGAMIVNDTTTIINPQNGDLIFNTGNQSYQYFDSVTNTWQNIAVPAMTTAQRNAIAKPNNGQTIFDTDQKCLHTYYNGIWMSQCGTQEVNNTTINDITNPTNGQIVYNTDNQTFQYYDVTTNTWRSLVVPAMDSAHRNAVPNPLAGQTVFNTNENCLNVYNGTEWESMCAVPPYLSKWFYMPSVVFDVSTQGIGFTKDLYQEYVSRFNAPKVISAASSSTSIKTALNRTDLIYFILDYDDTVFSNMSIDENGVMTYDIIGDATDATYMNIVFMAK